MLNPNYNKHSDINRLLKFINEAKVITMKQAICFLENLGLDKNRVENVLSILKKSNKVCYSKNEDFISVNPIFINNASKYYAETSKTSWLYISLVSKFDISNFDCKYPCKAFLLDTETTNSLHVFEIRHNSLDDDCIHIDTNFANKNTKNSPIKSIILIESLNDIDNIFLSDCIDILAFAILNYDENGIVNVRFFDKEKDELQVN